MKLNKNAIIVCITSILLFGMFIGYSEYKSFKSEKIELKRKKQIDDCVNSLGIGQKGNSINTLYKQYLFYYTDRKVVTYNYKYIKEFCLLRYKY